MLDDLIARLEKATGPSVELDEAIQLEVFTQYCLPEPPRYTASIDAALSLVPEGWAYHMIFEPRVRGNQQAIVWPPYQKQPVSGAPTMPLALCIAALKARKQ